MWDYEEIFKNVNYWFVYTISENTDVFDILVLNYGTMNFNLNFRFKRSRSLYYNDLIRDYVLHYSFNLDFLQLKNKLSKYSIDNKKIIGKNYVTT